MRRQVNKGTGMVRFLAGFAGGAASASAALQIFPAPAVEESYLLERRA